MKKVLIFVLALSLLLPIFAITPLNINAAMPAANALDGYQNLCLTYTFDTSASDYGRFTASDFAPYVGYYDREGELIDFFFDSFLFLPCLEYGPSGGLMHADLNNPSKAQDWTAYVNDTFADGYNVDALEDAFGTVKQQMGTSDKKAGVFFSILYPCGSATNFGKLGSYNLNFNNQEHRKYAVKWIIDEQIRLFNESNYKNLDLEGFYWLEEFFVTYVNGFGYTYDKSLFTYAAQYVHSLGLKFIWIPWYNASGYQQWSTLGFDVACMQPNLFWMDQESVDYNRVSQTASLCSANGMGMEIEVDYRVFVEDEYYNRYLIYLEDGMKSGAMNSIKMYYQDRNSAAVYKSAYKSEIPKYHLIYDLTYKYAKGTLTQQDIDHARSGYPVDITGLEPVSVDKPYTSSKAYGVQGETGYHEISGKELTDGIFATQALSSDWHAFYYAYTESNGRFQITVDLQTVRDDLTLFYAEFCNMPSAGIGRPENVVLEVSENGTSYEQLANLSLIGQNALIPHVKYETEPVTARYVRLTFGYSTGNFVFCSEFLVCADPNANNEPPVVEPVIPADGIYVNGLNSKIVTGACHIFTPDFGVINSQTANHVWTYNVVAKWSSVHNCYIVNRSFAGSGDTTPAITLATDEILIAAHQWDTVPESLKNIRLLAEAKIGDKLLLYNIDISNKSFNENSYARLEEAPQRNIFDINNDGGVDIFDYMLVKSICLGVEGNDEFKQYADVNSDDNIDIFDYLSIKTEYFK